MKRKSSRKSLLLFFFSFFFLIKNDTVSISFVKISQVKQVPWCCLCEESHLRTETLDLFHHDCWVSGYWCDQTSLFLTFLLGQTLDVCAGGLNFFHFYLIKAIVKVPGTAEIRAQFCAFMQSSCLTSWRKFLSVFWLQFHSEKNKLMRSLSHTQKSDGMCLFFPLLFSGFRLNIILQTATCTQQDQLHQKVMSKKPFNIPLQVKSKE